MGEVIVITSGKGGVGKTTTTANVGAALALRGKKVVLVDTDIGLRNLDVVMGLENRIVYDIVDVVEGKCKLRQALIKDKRFTDLFLLPAAQTRDKSAVNEEQMRELTGKLKEEFDFILIDCPAGIEQGFKNAIAGADRAIVVTNAEISSIRDADRIIGLLEASEIKNPELIINRLRPEMVKRGEMMDVEDILDLLSIDLIGVVPEDEYIITQTNKQNSDGTTGAPALYANIPIISIKNENKNKKDKNTKDETSNDESNSDSEYNEKEDNEEKNIEEEETVEEVHEEIKESETNDENNTVVESEESIDIVEENNDKIDNNLEEKTQNNEENSENKEIENIENEEITEEKNETEKSTNNNQNHKSKNKKKSKDKKSKKKK